MEKFLIIDKSNIWEEILNDFQNPDCYYSFEYGNLLAQYEKGKIFAAYYQNNNTKLFYPFIRRKVPFAMENLYDIVTPYGYGGPLINGSNDSIERFFEIFSSYCRLNNIITETIRFHPLYRNAPICKDFMEVQYIRKTTAIDLTNSLEEIRSNYTTMNKRNLKKALTNNLTCYIAEKTKENIKLFMNIYKETMDRNNASNFYYFDENFFIDQVKDSDLSSTYLIFIKNNCEIIAGVIIMVGKEYSHYHLGASRAKYLDLKPNNLLFDYMMEFCKIKGSKLLHLGGGYAEDDGLFKFKASFTKENHYDYYIGKKIFYPDKYEEINDEIREKYEVDEHFFPIYRGEMKAKLFQL